MLTLNNSEIDTLEKLLKDICYYSFKHEIQYWKDCKGTDAEKLDKCLVAAREALAIVQGRN
jgi:hypothetical protein